MQRSLKLENSGPITEVVILLIKLYSTRNLFFADTRMDLSNTATQEETLKHNSKLVEGVPPHTQWLATIKKQNDQLVTDKPTAYSATKSGEETRHPIVVPGKL